MQPFCLTLQSLRYYVFRTPNYVFRTPNYVFRTPNYVFRTPNYVFRTPILLSVTFQNQQPHKTLLPFSNSKILRGCINNLHYKPQYLTTG